MKKGEHKLFYQTDYMFFFKVCCADLKLKKKNLFNVVMEF